MALNTNSIQAKQASCLVMSDIRHRLKLAFENVAFYADKTWAHEPVAFRRANQELFARGAHLDETFLDDCARPRTVQDSIPYSKLAQYSNYEYNESRELCYASHGVDVSIYYPCLHHKGVAPEPWMLPEVEQLFIWLVYAPQYELFTPQFLGEYEEMKKYDEDVCSCSTVHKINPSVYETFERTPGKSRFKEGRKFTKDHEQVSTIIHMEDFDEMKLRMYLKQDKIKEIWERNCPPSKTKNMKVFHSPMRNYFVEEEAVKQPKSDYTNFPIYFNDLQEKSHDFRNMQTLMDSLNSEIKLSMNKEVKPVASKPETEVAEVPKQNAPPVRRLYSDVVQGLSPNKTSSIKTRQSEVTSPSSTITSNKETPVVSPKTNSTCTEDSATSSPQKGTKMSLASWKPTSNLWSEATNSVSSSTYHTNQERPQQNQSHSFLDTQYNKPQPGFERTDSLERNNFGSERNNLFFNTGFDNFKPAYPQEERQCPIHKDNIGFQETTTTLQENGTVLQKGVVQPQFSNVNRVPQKIQEGTTWIQGKHIMFQGRMQGSVQKSTKIVEENYQEEKYAFIQKENREKATSEGNLVQQRWNSERNFTYKVQTDEKEEKVNEETQIEMFKTNECIQESCNNGTFSSTSHVENEASFMQDGDGFQRRYSFEQNESFTFSQSHCHGKDCSSNTNTTNTPTWQFNQKKVEGRQDKTRTVSVKPKTPPTTTIQKTYPYNTISYSENVGVSSFCPFAINNSWNVFWSGASEQEQVIQCNYQAVNHYGSNVYPYQQLTNVGVMTNSISTINYNTTFSYGGACIGSGIQVQQGVNGRGQGYRNYTPNPNWIQQYRNPLVNMQQLSQPYFVANQNVPKAQRWNQQQYVRPTTPQYHSNPSYYTGQNVTRNNTQTVNSGNVFDERMKKVRRIGKVPCKEDECYELQSSSSGVGVRKTVEETPEFKYIYKKDGFAGKEVLSGGDNRRGEARGHIEVTETASEELERLALAEYQPSSENFYKDLEKEAEEQYEGLSENFVGPPSEEGFGGLPGGRCLDLFFLRATSLKTKGVLLDYVHLEVY